ncbi:hypothetical protein D3C79_552560 [compost metagenome]
MSRGYAVVPEIALEAYADLVAAHQNVLHTDRLHLHRAAYRPGLGRRPFVHGQTADQVGIDIAALLGTAITSIDIQGLLRTIDLDRHPALALDAADVDVQGTAIAGVTNLHARDTVEQVARRHPAEAVDLLAGQVH